MFLAALVTVTEAVLPVPLLVAAWIVGVAWSTPVKETAPHTLAVPGEMVTVTVALPGVGFTPAQISTR
jgi:hypothetical protein